MKDCTGLEFRRQTLQSALDRLKTQAQRNKMGQFSTPFALAVDIIEYAHKTMPHHGKIRFLDPAIGTGVFFSALHHTFPANLIESAQGFEIDEHYGKPARNLWHGTLLDCQVMDFTQATPPAEEKARFNLIVCNPPYVRHHYITGQKEQLRSAALNAARMNLSGLAGLYCYFMALAHRWLQANGIAGWLIPSEFMDVNYGQPVKDYLLTEVTLLQIHRFDPNDVQFDDALVSSAIVWFVNKKPSNNHAVKFTYGGSLNQPQHTKQVNLATLATERKWTRYPLLGERGDQGLLKLSDFFTIKRGIATGDNSFFIMPYREIVRRGLPLDQFRPILPSPRYLPDTIIGADQAGNPLLENQLFVLDCKLPPDEVKLFYPRLHAYLAEGIEKGVSERFLCKNRKIWYTQENRPESNFYCTYIGRQNKKDGKPFRFILNHSKAIVANSYLILYPRQDLASAMESKPGLKDRLFAALNQITGRAMLDEGRVYGGGLHKMEPKELANVPASAIGQLLP